MKFNRYINTTFCCVENKQNIEIQIATHAVLIIGSKDVIKDGGTKLQ